MNMKKKKIMLIVFIITIILNVCVLAEVVSEKRNILFGDADQNNIVDKKDAEIILNKIAEEKESNGSTIVIPETADTNLDGNINLLDVLDIARYNKAKNETNNSEWITKLEKEVEFGVAERVTIDLSKGNTGKVEVQSKNCGEITFESENTDIAEVDASGNIIAKQHGQTQIVVTEGRIGISKECTVIVQTSPTGITLNETSATLDLSGTKTVNLTGTITPKTSNTSTKITWTTLDNKIATVDSVGKVTGVSNGTTTITATTANGKKAECTIIVQTSPTSIKINEIETKLVKESLQLKTTIKPATVDANKKITWTSSNKNKATVDSNGKVKAVEPGRVTITAKTANGKTATQELIIGVNNNYIDFKNLSLNTLIKNAQTNGTNAALQNFAFLNYNKGNYLFFSQQSIKKVYDKVEGKEIEVNRLRTSRMKYDTTNQTATPAIEGGAEMILRHFSHGDTLEISTNSANEALWLWTLCDDSSTLTGMKYHSRSNKSTQLGTDAHDYDYIPKDEYGLDVTYRLHYANIDAEGKKTIYPKKILTVAMDEENNLIALRSGYSTNHTYDIYKFSEWKKIKKEEYAEFEKIKQEQLTNIENATKNDLKNEYINTYIEKKEREEYQKKTVATILKAYKNEVGEEEYARKYGEKYKLYEEKYADTKFVEIFKANFEKRLEEIKISTITHNSEEWMKNFVETHRSFINGNSKFKASYLEKNKVEYDSKKEIDIKEYRKIRDALGLSNHFQGFDIDGSYIYIYEDMTAGDNYDIVKEHATVKNNEFGDSLISVYDLAGKQIYNRVSVESNFSSKINNTEFYRYINKEITDFKNYEQEGLKVYNGVLYIGMALRRNNKTYQNILYFGDELGIKPKS